MNADILYADGTMDKGTNLNRIQSDARKHDDRGAYLRSILRGAVTSNGLKWDGRKRTFVAGGAA